MQRMLRRRVKGRRWVRSVPHKDSRRAAATTLMMMVLTTERPTLSVRWQRPMKISAPSERICCCDRCFSLSSHRSSPTMPLLPPTTTTKAHRTAADAPSRLPSRPFAYCPLRRHHPRGKGWQAPLMPPRLSVSQALPLRQLVVRRVQVASLEPLVETVQACGTLP